MLFTHCRPRSHAISVQGAALGIQIAIPHLHDIADTDIRLPRLSVHHDALRVLSFLL